MADINLSQSSLQSEILRMQSQLSQLHNIIKQNGDTQHTVTNDDDSVSSDTTPQISSRPVNIEDSIRLRRKADQFTDDEMRHINNMDKNTKKQFLLSLTLDATKEPGTDKEPDADREFRLLSARCRRVSKRDGKASATTTAKSKSKTSNKLVETDIMKELAEVKKELAEAKRSLRKVGNISKKHA